MNFTIEPVKAGDEHALAMIQTESWKAAFKNTLSAEALNRYTQLDKATAMYRHLLEHQTGHGYLLRVEGEPHCIAWWGDSRDADMADYAELICIHSLQNRWRRGYGRRMMETVLQDMTRRGYSKVMLWVFEANTGARKFYESFGFVPNGREKTELEAKELCYEKAL